MDNGNLIYYEHSEGYWYKREFDANGKEIYCEYSDGFWAKFEYDVNGNEIYYESSNGEIKDKRPKEIVTVTLDEIAAKFGISVDKLQIKKQ